MLPGVLPGVLPRTGVAEMLIDLEGMDGAGKSHQAARLQSWFAEVGLTTGAAHFPVYGSPTGTIITAFLKGLLPLSAQDAQRWYADNRREMLPRLEQLLREKDAVILDRYYPSGWAYGKAQGLSESWLAALDAGLPKPDLVFVLDLPVEATRARRKKRDVFETDLNFLNTVRSHYLDLARRHGWFVVNADAPREEVTAGILTVVRAALETGAAERHNGNSAEAIG